MKKLTSRYFLAAGIYASMAIAHADTVVLTESLVDKLACSGDYCGTDTVGKFSMTAKISGDTLVAENITLEGVTEDTPVSVSIGEYSFSSTLAAADSHVLTASKLTAKWSESQEGCGNSDCSALKLTKYNQISVNANANSLLLKIVGSNRTGDIDEYGARVFANMCDEVADGTVLQEVATITVGDASISGDLEVTCKKKTKTVSKNGESYELVSSSVKAKLAN